MTRYDTTTGHPLAGVPQEALDAARSVLRDAATWRDVDPEEADPIADAVVAKLAAAGMLRDFRAPVVSVAERAALIARDLIETGNRLGPKFLEGFDPDRVLSWEEMRPEDRALLASAVADMDQRGVLSGVELPHPLLVAAAFERMRQVEQKGFTAEHDQDHQYGELARAAAAYALPRGTGLVDDVWPWHPGRFRPGATRNRDLEKAVALLMAEWDRLRSLEFDAAEEST